MTMSTDAFYAALAEGVYQRNTLDAPLTLAAINKISDAAALQPADFLTPSVLNDIGLVGDFDAGNGNVPSRVEIRSAGVAV